MRRRSLSIAGVGFALLLAGCGSKPTARVASPSPLPSVGIDASRCFDEFVTTPAPEYLGLSESGAKRLATNRSDHLEVVAAEGRCLRRFQILYVGPDLTVEIALEGGRVVQAKSGRP